MEETAVGPVSDSDLDFDFTVDDIDFGDFFLRLDDGDDALPGLEVDPAEIVFADFEAIATAGGDGGVTDQEVPSVLPFADAAHIGSVDPCCGVLGEDNDAACADVEEGKGECDHADEVAAAGNNNSDSGEGCGGAFAGEKSPSSTASSSQEAESRRKVSKKHSQGKKKAKVDWTPELHRRFVQAVEELGIDKAVPSRILEIMGIDSLTRHNIASHLQKYRSHRKHMLAREVEAATWTTHRRPMYAAPSGAVKRPDSNAWTVPTIGFPPPWAPPPPADPASFWHHAYMRGPAAHMPDQVAVTPCVAVPMAAARFPAPHVRGSLPWPPPMYRPLVPPALAGKSQQDALFQLQIQPSSESIDAAIGDVLTKPWLPLPLGLKPPSVDSVMGELQRQGVANVPQACG